MNTGNEIAVRRAGRCRVCVVSMLIAGIFLTGCLYRGIRVVGLEQKAAQLESSRYRVLGESEGTSSSFNLFWVIPVTPRATYDRAVTEAISGMRGDSLIEIRTWMERQIWIVGMVEILHVKGKVIQYEK